MLNKRTRIQGYDFELYKEYDRVNLARINYEGKVYWFKARVDLVLIKPLEVLTEDSIREEFKKNGGDILLCYGTLICNGIEALGSFYKGRASYKSFRAFVLNYMDTRWQNRRADGVPYWKALRDDFRNGLAHGFTVDKGGFEASQNYFEMRPIGLEIDEKMFFNDFKKGYERFINDLIGASPISPSRLNFEKRFKEIFIDERPIANRPSFWKKFLNRLGF